MENFKGKFIVIEGIDGCGKTTQIELLRDGLLGHVQPCCFTREATEGPIGKLLRNTYLTGERKCDERVINLLYAADRLDHITNENSGILMYLDKGFNVFSDRYYLSSMAYNNYMIEDPEELGEAIYRTIDMNKINMDLLRPDATIYIDIDPDVAMQRINSREIERSVYETESKLQKIHNAYDLAIDILSVDYNETIIRIDGNRPVLDIHKDIYENVCRIINE